MKKILPLLIMVCAYNASAGQVILSEKPIEIGIPVGKEIIVKFPKKVTHTKVLDSTKQDNFGQFLTPEGVLYLNAHTEFGKTRMIAELSNKNVVVLDVRSGPGPHGSNIEIIEPRKQVKKEPEAVSKPKKNPYKPSFLRNGAHKTKSSSTKKKSSQSTYADMAKFAFRHYVGPSRLIGKKLGRRVKLTQKTWSKMIRVWGDRLHLRALNQWQIGDKYITVFLVNNISQQPFHFDPRAIRGRIEFAATLKPVLTPSGSVDDRTLWALITSVPINKAFK